MKQLKTKPILRPMSSKVNDETPTKRIIKKVDSDMTAIKQETSPKEATGVGSLALGKI